MKFFYLVLLSLTFIGCGKSSDTSNPENSPATPAIQRDIVFEAARGYNPSSWSNYTEEIVKDADARLPIELEVVEGNSGTGWTSITTPERKFCYRGNASNNNTANGTKFILAKEKTVLTEECHQTANDDVYDLDINLQTGQEIKVSVHGGGCSNSRGTCLNTTVKGSIEIIE